MRPEVRMYGAIGGIIGSRGDGGRAAMWLRVLIMRSLLVMLVMLVMLYWAWDGRRKRLRLRIYLEGELAIVGLLVWWL